MTKEELFPASEYPFRARKVVEWPERSLRVVSEVYCRCQLDSWDDGLKGLGDSAVVGEITSFDGTLSFSSGFVGDEKQGRCYVDDEGVGFVEVDLEKVLERYIKFLAAFGERFGDVAGEEADYVLHGKIDAALWVIF